MNDNSTPDQPSNPEASAQTPPSSAPGQHAPSHFGSDQARWQAPAAPQPGASYGTPPQPGGSFGHAAQSQPGAPQPGAPQPGAPQPGAHPGGAPYGAPQHGMPQPQHPTGSPSSEQPTLSLDPTLVAAPTGSTPQTGAAAQGPHSTEKRSGGPVKVAGLILAAALVGGVAGFGGSAIGTAVFDRPASQSATGPQSVTVNNPGSVNETTAIASEVLPSVVTIEVAGSSESGSGSGVILDKEGHVLTNTHVVTLGGAVADPAIRVTTSDGRIFQASVVGTDPVYDLAVIKLEGAKDLTPIEMADSSKLNVGDTAVAVGAPLGLSNSVTTGIVSALNRSIEVASSALPDSSAQPDSEGDQGGSGNPFQFDIPGMGQQQAKQSISIAVIQTDAAINPGNSGGALVDSKGSLIGINVAIATAGGSSSSEAGSIGLGFAIPSNIAQRVADEIIADGAATHGLLGATVRDASSVKGVSVAGAAIDTPTPGGAADEAGLKSGDIVTQFNGVPITGASDLTAQVRAAAAGSEATLSYVRSGRTYEAKVTLGELKL
ncbi:S1C family serine protease [Microbacterium sp. nov. GSS16]|uniref:S1C family serine protease n=1 Tax=Microbacterium sp. nov. GSS16 TaxID=3019890 RepID=UPI0023064863|nr:trypsin-like peptidase domain-containing protein [Microbacterium sp. nov. GSS16]WCD92559.1 trypsin-like peptidase domain-containing protein [Microbacterium sp. nov. GSS16]